MFKFGFISECWLINWFFFPVRHLFKLRQFISIEWTFIFLEIGFKTELTLSQASAASSGNNMQSCMLLTFKESLVQYNILHFYVSVLQIGIPNCVRAGNALYSGVLLGSKSMVEHEFWIAYGLGKQRRMNYFAPFCWKM